MLLRRVMIVLFLFTFALACQPAGDDTADDDITNDDATDDDFDDDVADDDTSDDDVIDDDAVDDDTFDDDTFDDDSIDDDAVDDDTVDDDTFDDDTVADDDFVPPSPVYGYYQEGYPGNWSWLEDQLPVFAEYDLTLFLGMDDVDVGDPALAQLLQAAQALGVEVRAWVLLPYAIGYWPGETNAEQFATSAMAFAEWFIAEQLPVEWIVVDMETDVNTIGEINQLLEEGRYLELGALLLSHWTPLRFRQAAETYRQLVDDLHELGMRAMVVTAPMALDDMEDEDDTIQDIMDIPVSMVDWDEVSTMVYTTTFEEYLGIEYGPHVVYDYALSTVKHFGDRASIALGISSQMENSQQLADEIAAAKAGGVDRIQVYYYYGSYIQPDPDEWHSTFYADPLQPPPEFGTYLLRGLLSLADRIF